jgi:hypothetical protein
MLFILFSFALYFYFFIKILVTLYVIRYSFNLKLIHSSVALSVFIGLVIFIFSLLFPASFVIVDDCCNYIMLGILKAIRIRITETISPVDEELYYCLVMLWVLFPFWSMVPEQIWEALFQMNPLRHRHVLLKPIIAFEMREQSIKLQFD